MSSRRATDPYAGMRTRGHWKREHAARALADWAESGEPLSAFARRHRLGLRRLQFWRVHLEQSAAESKAVRLLPVVPRQAPLIAIGDGASSAVSVMVGSVRVDINNTLQADPRWLAKLIFELQGAQS